MAFIDDYTPIKFVDLPSETTPIDATNLNKMDNQIKKLTKFASTVDPEIIGDKLNELEEKTSSLKEDLSNKITKFYASNQGETHLVDSDNGKIQDMMIYGKSSQDGTPTPEKPVEIKSVVNPTVKLLGSNILKIRDGEYQDAGCTVTVSNGVIKLNGTSTGNTRIYLPIDTPSMLKEGTEIIFCPNNIGGIEKINKCYLDYSNENTKSFSTVSNTINTPYVITKKDSKYEFKLSIKITKENTFNNETWKPQILIGKQITPFEPYKEQSIQLPMTLNAIPVSSGGNVTINEQQYIADYVDVERGKLVRMCKEVEYNGDESWKLQSVNANNIADFKLNDDVIALGNKGLSNKLLLQNTLIANTDSEGFLINIFKLYIRISKNRNISTVAEFKNFLSKNPIRVLLAFITPEEIDLTPEEIAAFKALATYYPVTNISVNSEQLDGYTVFNYPISMANGWNYVKQQLNDNRDYIYDMDTQSAEAYVNSEYAVALTELEV